MKTGPNVKCLLAWIMMILVLPYRLLTSELSKRSGVRYNRSIKRNISVKFAACYCLLGCNLKFNDKVLLLEDLTCNRRAAGLSSVGTILDTLFLRPRSFINTLP